MNATYYVAFILNLPLFVGLPSIYSPITAMPSIFWEMPRPQRIFKKIACGRSFLFID